jgi:hypothetical protein
MKIVSLERDLNELPKNELITRAPNSTACLPRTTTSGGVSYEFRCAAFQTLGNAFPFDVDVGQHAELLCGNSGDTLGVKGGFGAFCYRLALGGGSADGRGEH